MKFDAAIGNPPYQRVANAGSPIWQDFALRNLGHVRKGGKIAMIHPPGWRGGGRPSMASIGEVRRELREIDMEWISMTSMKDCGKVFRGIAIPFDVYVARKESTPDFATEIECTDGSSIRENIKGRDFVPNFDFAAVDGLIAGRGEERVNFLRGDASLGAKQEWMSAEKGGEFVHPCVWTISANREARSERGGRLSCFWSNTKNPPAGTGHFGVPKAIFIAWQRAGIPYADADGELGLGEHAAAIADEPENIPKIAAAMDSPGFRRIMESVQFGTHEWNMGVIRSLRKDFWKEFA